MTLDAPGPAAPAAAIAVPRRRFQMWTRTLHIYVSLVAFLALLFFGLTGFMMNHGEWFGVGEIDEQEQRGEVPAAMLAEPDRLALVELLRSDYGARGPLVELDVGDEEIRAVFAKPGHLTDAIIDRASGDATVVREVGGASSILAAVHKGDDTGAVGSLLIDLTALMLVFVAVTGLILWTALRRRRRIGIAALAAAALLAAVFAAIVL